MSKELTLRSYQPRDIPRLVNMFMASIPLMPNYAMITPQPDRIRYVLQHNIQNASSFAGWVVCDEFDIPQGAAAGWCVQNIMSYDFVADDVFMWVEPEWRTYKSASMLLRTYITWAEARGAKLIRASHTGGTWPKGSKDYELFDKVLKRHGFQEIGSIYHLNKYGDTIQ